VAVAAAAAAAIAAALVAAVEVVSGIVVVVAVVVLVAGVAAGPENTDSAAVAVAGLEGGLMTRCWLDSDGTAVAKAVAVVEAAWRHIVAAALAAAAA